MSDDKQYLCTVYHSRTVHGSHQYESVEKNCVLFFLFFFSIVFPVCIYDELRLTISKQVQIYPKKDVVYAKRGKSKSVSLSHRIIKTNSDIEQDPAYVPTGSSALASATIISRGTSKKVTSASSLPPSRMRSAH